jgi:hypothetical protein
MAHQAAAGIEGEWAQLDPGAPTVSSTVMSPAKMDCSMSKLRSVVNEGQSAAQMLARRNCP